MQAAASQQGHWQWDTGSSCVTRISIHTSGSLSVWGCASHSTMAAVETCSRWGCLYRCVSAPTPNYINPMDVDNYLMIKNLVLCLVFDRVLIRLFSFYLRQKSTNRAAHAGDGSPSVRCSCLWNVIHRFTEPLLLTSALTSRRNQIVR